MLVLAYETFEIIWKMLKEAQFTEELQTLPPSHIRGERKVESYKDIIFSLQETKQAIASLYSGSEVMGVFVLM